MKKRLTKLIQQIENEISKKDAEFLAENLIERGVIYLPCKIGDPVFEVVPECNVGIKYCPFCGGIGFERCIKKPCIAYIEEKKFTLFDYNEIGKTLFLTREKAEKKLEKMVNKNEESTIF